MEPTLYIIMRADIPDLTPGKGMAQAAHAQADFDAKMLEIAHNPDFENREEILLDYNDWASSYNFGRTIVLSATEEKIREVVVRGTVAGITIDPTYPWRNYYGETFITEELTCGWLFVPSTISISGDVNLTKDLPLHK